MSTNDAAAIGITTDDVDITSEDVAPPPLGAPVDFRERLTLALRTTEPRILAAAEAGYRGVYPSQHDYVAERIAERLDPSLAWILACASPDKRCRAVALAAKRSSPEPRAARAASSACVSLANLA